MPERMVAVEIDTRHIRELLEQHVVQTQRALEANDKSRAEQTAKLDVIVNAMERGKGGLLVFGFLVGTLGGTVGGKIGSFVGFLFK
jgi:hypothetical protein